MKAWAKSFYLSAAWEKTRAAYLMSQDYICERCGQPAKIVHHKHWLNRENINDMAHVEDGEKYYIRKEYTEVSELQNSNGSGLYRSLTPAGKVKVCTLRLIR